MTNQQILQADLLDILFEGRNKLYGAYLLRKQYPQQLTKALVAAMGIVFSLVFLLQPSPRLHQPVIENGDVTVTEFHALPPEVPKPKPPQVAAKQNIPVKQRNFTANIQLVQKELLPAVPTINDLATAVIGNETIDGVPLAVMQTTHSKNYSEPAPAVNTTMQEAEKEVVPDRQPQFPGGMQAWLAFLNRHLQSPQELEAGEKKTVVIRFLVAEDGTVTNFNVVQSAGSMFDNEVIRVLKKMPKWTPAFKGGEPLPVSFSQPVTFVGLEN